MKAKDVETKEIEKKFQKDKSIDVKEFINQYMTARKDFYKL